MIAKADVQRAIQLLKQFRQEKEEKLSCPFCNSSNIELVSTPRKAINWLSAITTFFLGDYAMAVEKQYHCFNCKKEFKVPKESAESAS